MTDHLGYEKHASDGRGSGNSRNGTRRKTLKGDQGKIPIEIPRDRNGDFELQLIPNGQSRILGFDDKIISLYARGMTAREIQAHLEELYGVDVSPTLISNITDVVLDEVKVWQSRPLDAIYPILYLDALQVKIRDERPFATRQSIWLWASIWRGRKSNSLDFLPIPKRFARLSTRPTPLSR